MNEITRTLKVEASEINGNYQYAIVYTAVNNVLKRVDATVNKNVTSGEIVTSEYQGTMTYDVPNDVKSTNFKSGDTEVAIHVNAFDSIITEIENSLNSTK
jgi:hypothetical protein